MCPFFRRSAARIARGSSFPRLAPWATFLRRSAAEKAAMALAMFSYNDLTELKMSKLQRRSAAEEAGSHRQVFYFHSFQVHAPQVMAQTTQTEAVAIVAAVAPKRSESSPAARLEMLMVRVTSP